MPWLFAYLRPLDSANFLIPCICECARARVRASAHVCAYARARVCATLARAHGCLLAPQSRGGDCASTCMSSA
eukprot:8010419-Alexandrium_andersonii.AAC.1